MIKIYSHHDRLRIFQVKQLLEDNGVPCFVKNEFAIGAMGELSPMDILPEVWLADADWKDKAQKLISQLELKESDQSQWQCAKCLETNGASFEICWKCETPAPSWLMQG